MKRCRKCILPESFPGISFNDEGICNYCKTYKPQNPFGEKEFYRILSKYHGKGDDYDCIVPISGGRDSSFVLHQIAANSDLRIAAVWIDSGEQTREAIQNIKRMIDIMDVDYFVIRDDKSIDKSKKNLKKNFNIWLKKPSINLIIPILNLPTKMINLKLYKFAEERKIPLIIGGLVVGNSSFEQENFKTGFFGIYPDDSGLYSSFQKMQLAFLYGFEYLRNPYYLHYSGLRESLLSFYAYFFDNLIKPKNIDTIGFYDYVYWDENRILSTIMNELDWKSASDTTTTWRIDDKSSSLSNYLYYRLVGFTEHDEMYSKMIREGQLSREEGFHRCLSDQRPRIASLMTILDELDVEKNDLDRALDSYRIELWRELLRNGNL